MSERLAILTPTNPDAPVPLPERGRLTIGSSSDRADLVISAQGVAEIHCIIARTKDNGWAVQDMGSDFGTILDGQRVDVARVRADQTLLIGSASLKVVDLDSTGWRTREDPPPMETPPEKPSPSTPAESDTASAEENPFLEIPGYSIQETLGRGGMGAVFRAKQDRLHRDVALKILSPRLAADTEFVRKFHREAQAAAALNHPNVVTVYDVGEAGGTHYLAMEYMDDESLEELLAKEGRLPWKSVANLLLGAARGLVYAESRGIVHRDIKPSNLMLNSAGQVKLADLGLAQRADDETGDGRVFGTPHFMPPEQIRGDPVDRRSDIYSLGATGYRLLSGYTPFEGVSSREILRAVLTEDFAPLSSHVSAVPGELTNLIERMIARTPEGRPQSAESVVSHLEAISTGQSTPTPPKVVRVSKKQSRSGIAAILLLTAGVGATLFITNGGIGWDLFQGQQEPHQPPQPTGEPHAQAAPTDGSLDPPEDPDSTPPSDPTETLTGDDDVAQKLFEIEAENALLRIQSSERTLIDRQAALLALAQKYNGTTSASEARESAKGIGDLIRMENEAAAAVTSRREAVMLGLKAAADLEVFPPRPGDALRGIATVPNQDHLVNDQPFLEQREALRVEICRRALEQALAQLNEAKGRLAELDTATVHDSLQDLVIRLQLPDLPPEDRPLHFEELRRVASEAKDLLRNLDTRREEVVVERVRDDAQAIAATCHSLDGLEKSLAALRPADAADSLESLAATLSTDEARTVVTGLAADFRAAAAVLSALTADFSSWRRDTIIDPRPRRGNAAVVEISPGGVIVDGSTGAVAIEWSAFSDQPEALHQLFLRRLDRNWTEAEEAGIAALIRHAAVLNTIRIARDGFEDPQKLRDKDIANILGGYGFAGNWAHKTLQSDLLERELAAASSLTQALGLAAEEQWGSATSTLSHATRAYSDTLLLLILSDGRGAPEAEAPASPEEELDPHVEGLDPEGPAVPSPPAPGDD